MNYTSKQLFDIQMLADSISRTAAELDALSIYCQHEDVAIDCRKRSLQASFAKIHAIVLGDMSDAVEDVTGRIARCTLTRCGFIKEGDEFPINDSGDGWFTIYGKSGSIVLCNFKGCAYADWEIIEV